jgi:tetratricopeptide (TPR) repeat protein
MSRSASFLAVLAIVPVAACSSMPAHPVTALKAPLVVAVEPLPEPTSQASVLGMFLAADTAVLQGRNDIATDYFARAAEQVAPSGDTVLKEQAFGAAVQAGRIDQAANLAPVEGEASPNNVRLGRLVVGVNSLAKGQGQASFDVLNPYKIGPPYRTAAVLLRPWAAAAAGNVETSVAAVEIRGDPQAQAYGQLNRALLFERAGKVAEADAAFKVLMGQDTRIAIFTLTYGAFLERQNRRPEALALYEALATERPDDLELRAARDRARARRPAPAAPTLAEGAGQALLAIAETMLAQNQQTNAVAYLYLSLRLDPKQPLALMQIADFLEGQGNDEAARATFAAVPKGTVEYLGARSRLVASYLDSKENGHAVALAQDAARDFPDDVEAQLLLADTLRETNDYGAALPILNKVVALRGKDASWQLYYTRAIVLEKTGHWPDAEKDLQAALKIAPNQAELQNYLGYSWADRNVHLDEAMALLRRARQAQPNNGAILDSLGWANFRKGDLKSAVEFLESAVAKAPAEPDINDHLGDVYLKAGRRLEARYQWQRVLTLNPDPQMKKDVLAKLAANPDDTQSPAAVAAARPDAPTP